MTILDLGITPAGEVRGGEDAAAVRFDSIESFAQLLAVKNRHLLALIARHSPDSLDELVALSGRAKSNLSRTLGSLARAGLVRMERSGHKVAPRLAYQRIALTFSLVGIDSDNPLADGDRP